MRQRLSVTLIMLLFIITISIKSQAVFEEFEWAQEGYIKYSFGRSWVSGNDASYNSSFQLENGFNQDYFLNLGGKIMTISQEVSYYFIKEPSIPIDFQMHWDNPLFSAQVDKNIKLNFSELNLAFNKNRIDGFVLHTPAEELSLFYGEESYIPQTKTFIVYQPSTTEFALLEIPSAGDILDYSEVIMLNGEILTRIRDYSINYLNGKLQLFIALEPGMIIEAKYLFIVTNQELAPKGETLQGAVYTKHWVENFLSGFYFKRGKNDNQVVGMAGQVVDGPLRVRGEMAISQNGEKFLDQAYDLTSTYVDENIDINYQVRNIGPNFREIGVNQYTRGNTQKFDVKYKAEENIDFQVEISRYHIANEKDVTTALTKKGLVDYRFTDRQSLQVIFQERNRKLNFDLFSDQDLSVGYTYKSRPLTIAFGQSLQSNDTRYLKLQIDVEKLRLMGNYSVDSRLDGKDHKINLDLTFRPIKKYDLSTFLEYAHPFGSPKGNMRLYVNTNWNPTNTWSVNGGYMYFNNIRYQSHHQRYNCMVNYSTRSANSSINTVAQFAETFSVKSQDIDLNWSTGINLPLDVQLNYSFLQKNFREYMKIYNMVNQEKSEHLQTLGLSYALKDLYIINTAYSYANNGFSTAGIWNREKGYTFNLGINYQPDFLRQLSANTSYEHKGIEYNWQFDSRVAHPIGPFKLDNTGKVVYSLNNKQVSKYNLKIDVTFPKLLCFTPNLLLNSEYQKERAKHQRKDHYSAILKYHRTAEEVIFIEFKQDRLVDWRNSHENYRAYGVYSGVEITY